MTDLPRLGSGVVAMPHRPERTVDLLERTAILDRVLAQVTGPGGSDAPTGRCWADQPGVLSGCSEHPAPHEPLGLCDEHHGEIVG